MTNENQQPADLIALHTHLIHVHHLTVGPVSLQDGSPHDMEHYEAIHNALHDLEHDRWVRQRATSAAENAIDDHVEEYHPTPSPAADAAAAQE